MFRAVGPFFLRDLSTGLLCLALTISHAHSQVIPGQAGGLVVRVVQGNQAYHSIGTRTGVMTIIEVRDEARRLVEGASVTFEAPETGAGGAFPGAGRLARTTTNSIGRASTTGFIPNTTAGRFPIEVTVAAGSRSARATIWQTNSVDRFDEGLPRERGIWKWVAVAGAAGGATGLVFLLRGGSTQRPVWTPGSPVIGAPR